MKLFGRTACLLSLLTLPVAATADVVAFDMVASGNMNLVSYSNAWTDAFGSPGDGFQKYRRGVSPSIPFSVLDDTNAGFPTDSLGIIDGNNTHEFFGATDTDNADNPGGAVSATWQFDVSGFNNLTMSLDAGAMGDFEATDIFSWEYSIDGGASQVAFMSTVDELGSHDYTLAGGAMFTLSDPMLLNGDILTNELATFMVPLIGSGNLLSLTLNLNTNGGSEAMAFQNLVIQGDAAVVPVPAAVWLFASACLGFLRKKRTV